MDEQSSVASPRAFPPYQRRRLHSRTFEATVQILSLFVQQSHQTNPLATTTLKSGQDTEEKEGACLSKNNVLPDSNLEHLVEAEKHSADDTEEGEVADDAGELNLKDKCAVDDSLRPENHNLEKAHDAGDNEGSWRTYEKFMLSILSPPVREASGDGSFPKIGLEVEERDNEVNKTRGGCYLDSLSGAISEQVVSENQEKKVSTGVVEAGAKKKRKTTKERSEKKKAKRRKKRAELDRQSGVKRLKLQPISKPKVVNLCKYYINGKCQQGDACKFSHDTTPLTKSKPCNFLALNKCLKGDDCPYDHELSRYPCNNYKAQGFCPRGDSCLFSHKVSLMNDSPASDLNKAAQEISSLQGSGNTGKQPHTRNTCQQSVDRSKSTTPRILPSFRTSTWQPTRQDVAEVKPPAQVPKGINFLSFGKAQRDSSSKPQQNELPTAREKDAAACIINEGAAEKLQPTDEIPGRKPAPTLSLFPPSTMIESKDEYKTNSARKAPCSTSLPTTKCGSKVKNPCLQPFASDGNIPTVSSILQEFLFNGQ